MRPRSRGFRASSSTLPLIAFSTQTGINASASERQSTWSALKTMGTDQFVGGVIGNFKLDESHSWPPP